MAGSIDFAVTLLALATIYLGYCAVRFIVHPRAFRFPRPAPGLSATIWVLLTVIYLAVGWTTTGRTIGDQVTGLRVLTARAERLGGGRALIRAILCVWFPVGLLWSALSRRNLSVQDVLCRTVVIYDWQAMLPSRAPPRSAMRSGPD